MPLVVDRYLDSRSDGGAVGLHADQMDPDPVVAVAGVFKETELVTVRPHRATDYGKNVLVAVVVDVGEIESRGHEDLVEPGLLRHVAEGAVAHVLVELQGGGLVGKP